LIQNLSPAPKTVFLEEKTPAYQTGEFYDGRLNEKTDMPKRLSKTRRAAPKRGRPDGKQPTHKTD
jgi:hypothetical protein